MFLTSHVIVLRTTRVPTPSVFRSTQVLSFCTGIYASANALCTSINVTVIALCTKIDTSAVVLCTEINASVTALSTESVDDCYSGLD